MCTSWRSVSSSVLDASAATVTPEPGPAPAAPRRTFMVAKVSWGHGTVTPGPEPVVGPRIQVAGHGASDCSDSENLKQLQCQCSHGRDSTGFAHCVTASGPCQRTFAKKALLIPAASAAAISVVARYSSFTPPGILVAADSEPGSRADSLASVTRDKRLGVTRKAASHRTDPAAAAARRAARCSLSAQTRPSHPFRVTRTQTEPPSRFV